MVKIIEGNLFDSEAEIIAHQVNCQQKMNSGVAKQIRQLYPSVYRDYIYRKPELGNTVIIDVYSKRKIANLYAQDKYGYDGKRYTDYEALQKCFDYLNEYASKYGYTVAMPYKIGCDRGGADWNIVYKIIEDSFTVDVELWRLNDEN